MSVRLKNLKGHQGRTIFNDQVDVIKKVYITKDNKWQIKLSKRWLKLKNDHVILVSKRLPKDKIHCNLCVKHARLKDVNEISRLTDDYKRCRILLDPTGNEIMIQFKSVESAKYLTGIIEYHYNRFIEVYKDISATIMVINEASDILEGLFSVIIDGSVCGNDMKKMIEERFKKPGLLSMKYSLEIQRRTNIVPVVDEMPISFLYEYFYGDERPWFCSSTCVGDNLPEGKEITLLVLDQANIKRKDFIHLPKSKQTQYGLYVLYNIDERWTGDVIPTWLLRLLADIYFYGPNIEGIFRLSSLAKDLPQYYLHMLTKDDFIVKRAVAFKASILKMFIMKIEGGIFNGLADNDIDQLIEGIDTSEKFLADPKMVSKLLNVLKSVPANRFNFLQHLLLVLRAVADSNVSRMDTFNLGTCLSPSLFNQVTYTNIESTEKSIHLSVFTGCMVSLVDRIVDEQTRDNIIATFTTHKSEQDFISESPLSVTSDSSMTPLKKLSRDIYDELFPSMTEDDGDEDDEEDDNDEVNGSSSTEEEKGDVVIRTRSRICMGAMLYDRLNSPLSHDENVDPLEASHASCEDRENRLVLSPKERLSVHSRRHSRPSGSITPITPMITPITSHIVTDQSQSHTPTVTTVRHVSLMGTRVTSVPRERRKYSHLQSVRAPVTVRTQLRHSVSRKAAVNTATSSKNDRSRSPYVRSMVERYEQQMRHPATRVAACSQALRPGPHSPHSPSKTAQDGDYHSK